MGEFKPIVSIESETALWRSREVRYYKGDWTAVKSLLPRFDLRPFTAGKDEPSNPYLQTVMRRPMTAAERPIPVAVVSHAYSLVPHIDVAELCHKEVVEYTDCQPEELRYEVGLSELGEWMNFRIYFPERYSFKDLHDTLDLRLECFNSVDGWCCLLILFGWLRFVCSNGLVIGDSRIEIRDRHGPHLDLKAISCRLRAALKSVEADRLRMTVWQTEVVQIKDIATWSNDEVSERWGKKAAARVFHICNSGKDIELVDPFALGPATEKPVKYLDRVPGSPARAKTKYDVLQALSFVATRRKNAEERVKWQTGIPSLLGNLHPPPHVAAVVSGLLL